MNDSLAEGDSTKLVWKEWVHEITGEEEELPVYDFKEMPPLYNNVDTPSPKSAIFNVGQDNTRTDEAGGQVSPWSWTLNTAQFVLDHLNANPPPSYNNYGGYVDPNFLQKGHSYNGDGHDDTAAIHNATYGQAWDDQADSPYACVIKLNNDDLHSVAMMLSADSDDESVAAESDDDENPTVHTEDIIRHAWRGVNTKYVVMHNGRRHFLTADQWDNRFSGVKSALWGYWKTKSAKRMPQAKLIGHLKRHGNEGSLQRDV
ncbi:hypothetical protein QFC20_002541 [Naganishia adeliensis]|uniref:Uncharacterized protein n=1 Tax=Naganishia adeliensis TaxID=92952 RepID=A0ACC2WL71_9TREE|nr:hypothetical protein QFC20_002541 [Naganishia adeliensis]